MSALPVNAPAKPVAVNVPSEGLYVKVPSDSKPIFPPSTSPPDVKTKALSSLVLSLSVIVTVVATAAVVAFDTVVPAITDAKVEPPTVIASASNVPSKSPSTASILPLNIVAVTVPVLGLYVKSPSDSKPILPPSTSPPAVNIIALSSFVLSLSVIVTAVATAAVVAFETVVPAITVLSDDPPIVKASVSRVPSTSTSPFISTSDVT